MNRKGYCQKYSLRWGNFHIKRWISFMFEKRHFWYIKFLYSARFRLHHQGNGIVSYFGTTVAFLTINYFKRCCLDGHKPSKPVEIKKFNIPEVPFFKHKTDISLVKWTAYTILNGEVNSQNFIINRQCVLLFYLFVICFICFFIWYWSQTKQSCAVVKPYSISR